MHPVDRPAVPELFDGPKVVACRTTGMPLLASCLPLDSGQRKSDLEHLIRRHTYPICRHARSTTQPRQPPRRRPINECQVSRDEVVGAPSNLAETVCGFSRHSLAPPSSNHRPSAGSAPVFRCDSRDRLPWTSTKGSAADNRNAGKWVVNRQGPWL